MWVRGRRGIGRGREGIKQTFHWAWNATRGSISRLWHHDLSRNPGSGAELTEPPDSESSLMKLCTQTHFHGFIVLQFCSNLHILQSLYQVSHFHLVSSRVKDNWNGILNNRIPLVSFAVERFLNDSIMPQWTRYTICSNVLPLVWLITAQTASFCVWRSALERASERNGLIHDSQLAVSVPGGQLWYLTLSTWLPFEY